MKSENVVVERTYNAPIDKVWSAITNVDEMKNWYFQLEDFKPKVGFKFDFLGGPEDGKQYLHLCEVTEVEEGKKITYSWRYDNYPGNSFVTWELFDKGDQTLLRLTHAGLDTLEEGGPDFAKENFVEGWTYFVHTALKGYLESED
ncbi:SRPBCC domain-containing protein [Pedobacter polaris]|uniref:SRPBCC domain-containing protein n=1 Tax=Pedobacter polaris TaxID=2571273 RepID=A0A4V5P015_9SPHI|nr:SRPBCC domain-containing protein [Pedobacter polaris]TKC10852.1 SRPBCC domain-containing protein [Pedobacter polaris]